MEVYFLFSENITLCDTRCVLFGIVLEFSSELVKKKKNGDALCVRTVNVVDHSRKLSNLPTVKREAADATRRWRCVRQIGSTQVSVSVVTGGHVRAPYDARREISCSCTRYVKA